MLREDEELVVKAISTKRYMIQLIQMKDNSYVIHYEYGEESFTTRPLADLNLAMQVFDDMLGMMEGN